MIEVNSNSSWFLLSKYILNDMILKKKRICDPMEKIWIKKELYILNYEFLKFYAFFWFFIWFLFIFFFTKIAKKGITYLQMLMWQAGSATSWHVARGTIERMRRGAEATWQSRGWPTRGAGGAQGTATWQEATRPRGSRWAPVWGAMW